MRIVGLVLSFFLTIIGIASVFALTAWKFSAENFVAGGVNAFGWILIVITVLVVGGLISLDTTADVKTDNKNDKRW